MNIVHFEEVLNCYYLDIRPIKGDRRYRLELIDDI